MDPKALIALMGPPTENSQTDLSWDAYEWQFNAFFGSDGSIHQLDINDIQLSPQEKADLKCATTRL